MQGKDKTMKTKIWQGRTRQDQDKAITRHDNYKRRQVNHKRRQTRIRQDNKEVETRQRQKQD
jgi:hypothetical protein